MRYFVCLILFLAFAGCGQVCDECGGKVSDAQITFFVGGQHMIIGDYAGSTVPESMVAQYFPSDSILRIYGNGNQGPGVTSGRIEFVVRGFAHPSGRMYEIPDTGTFFLDLPVAPPEFLWDDTLKINARDLEGGAGVSLYFDTGSYAFQTYATDVKHTGTLRITEVDSVRDVFSGTFNFLAIDTSMGSSLADTVRVVNGVISKMRIPSQ